MIKIRHSFCVHIRKEFLMRFPQYRLRRLRKNELFRRMVRETHLRPEDFILPLFVCKGLGVRKTVKSMPGVFQLSPDQGKVVLVGGMEGDTEFEAGGPQRRHRCGQIARPAARSLSAPPAWRLVPSAS